MFIKLKFGKVTRKVKLLETDFDSIKNKAEELFGEQVRHCLYMYRDIDSEIVSIFGDEDMEACFEKAEDIGNNCITLILRENTEEFRNNARSISKKRAVVDESESSSDSSFEEIDNSAEKKMKNKIMRKAKKLKDKLERKAKKLENKIKRKEKKIIEKTNRKIMKEKIKLEKKKTKELQKMKDDSKSLIEEIKEDSVSFEKKNKGMPEFVKCIIKQKKMWWKKNKNWWKKDNRDNWYKDKEGKWWKKIGEASTELTEDNQENFYEDKNRVWWQKMVSWGADEGPWKEHKKPWFTLKDLFFKGFKDEFKEFRRNPELIMKLFQKCGEEVKMIIRKNAKIVIDENSDLVEEGRERLQEFEKCKEQHSSRRQDTYVYKKHHGRNGRNGRHGRRNHKRHYHHQKDSKPVNGEEIDRRFIDKKINKICKQFRYQNKDKLREEILTGLENGAQLEDLVQKKREQKKQIKYRVKTIMSALPHLKRRVVRPVVIADLLDGKDSDFTLNKFLVIQSEDTEEEIDQNEVQKRVNTLVKIFPHIERKDLRKEAIVDIKGGKDLKDTLKRLFA